MNGHKFVARQFYQIMMCAYCGDFLLKASGYQCEDCRYTCHRECYPKVVTKCISKSNAETVSFCSLSLFAATNFSCELRKPTRTKSITVFPTASRRLLTLGPIGAVTVATCFPSGARTPRNVAVGYLVTILFADRLSFGLECDITCHASCAHLVPDFCGMTMEKANALLHQIHEIKSHQRQAQPKAKKQPSYQQQPQPQNWGLPPAAPPEGNDLYNDFSNMRIGGKGAHGRTDSGGSIVYPITGPAAVPGMPGSPQPTPAKPTYDAPPYRPSMEADTGVPGLVSEPARRQS